MLIQCCYQQPPSNIGWDTIASLILTVFATLISIGYLLKPWLVYSAFCLLKDKNVTATPIPDNNLKLAVKIENKNFLLAAKEIKCEMAVSETIGFDESQTLRLVKDYTLFLKPSIKIGEKLYKRDYIFKSIFTIDEIMHGLSNENKQDCQNLKPNTPLTSETDAKVKPGVLPDLTKKYYKFLRVRLLATNLLGVRKHYERIYKLDDLKENKPMVLECESTHKKLTHNLIKEELSRLNK
jgi:hypothetical protein